SLIEILNEHLYSEPRPLVSCLPAIRELVFRCLRKDPEQRFASTEDLLKALKEAQRTVSSSGLLRDGGAVPEEAFGEESERTVSPIGHFIPVLGPSARTPPVPEIAAGTATWIASPSASAAPLPRVRSRRGLAIAGLVLAALVLGLLVGIAPEHRIF